MYYVYVSESVIKGVSLPPLVAATKFPGNTIFKFIRLNGYVCVSFRSIKIFATWKQCD